MKQTACDNCKHHKVEERKKSFSGGTRYSTEYKTKEHLCKASKEIKSFDPITGSTVYGDYMSCYEVNRGQCEYYYPKK